MNSRYGYRGHWNVTQGLVVIALVVIGLLFIFRGACAESDGVKSAVEKQGYSKVKLGEKHYLFVSFRGCSSHDAAMWGAKGENAKGKRVDLIVCSGWPFKGVTVRTE